MIKLHVFDIDGTVLDSMRMWDGIAFIYLDSLGISAPEELAAIIDPMPMPEIYKYLADNFNIPGDAESIEREISELLSYQYAHNVKPFADTIGEMEELKKKGERMVAFSNTPHAFLDIAIDKYNLHRFFETVFCVEDIGARKDSPASFTKLMQITGVNPSDVLVHDDSDFALNAARTAGCQVKAYDRYR